MIIKINVWTQNTYSTTGMNHLASLTTPDKEDAIQFLEKYDGKGTIRVEMEINSGKYALQLLKLI